MRYRQPSRVEIILLTWSLILKRALPHLLRTWCVTWKRSLSGEYASEILYCSRNLFKNLRENRMRQDAAMLLRIL